MGEDRGILGGPGCPPGGTRCLPVARGDATETHCRNLSPYIHLSQPGQREIQAELLHDYKTNVDSYPAWQTWLRQHKPPTLVVWGKNDPSFVAAGGEAFKRDLPDAEIHLLDAGHFALDEKTDEIANFILAFMTRHPA